MRRSRRGEIVGNVSENVAGTPAAAAIEWLTMPDLVEVLDEPLGPRGAV